MFEYGNIENVEKQVPPRSLGNVAVAGTCQRRYFMLEKLVNIFERIKVWVLTLTPAQIASLLILIAALYVARKVMCPQLLPHWSHQSMVAKHSLSSHHRL